MFDKKDQPIEAVTIKEIPNLDSIELLFFAYRDFVADPDKVLVEMGFGRAHHRVLYFVSTRPGMTVAELLDILKITKQSLARVLRQLLDSKLVVQIAGERDRRKRLLYVSDEGRALLLQLSNPQSKRMDRAFSALDEHERDVVLRFLKGMISE